MAAVWLDLGGNAAPPTIQQASAGWALGSLAATLALVRAIAAPAVAGRPV